MKRISLRRVRRCALLGGVVALSVGVFSAPALAHKHSSVSITGPTSVTLGTPFSFKVTGFLAAPASDVAVYELSNPCPAKVSGAIGSGGELQQIAPHQGHKFSLKVNLFARIPGAHNLCAYVFNVHVPSRKTYAHAKHTWTNH
jgi:hypothetical protein